MYPVSQTLTLPSPPPPSSPHSAPPLPDKEFVTYILQGINNGFHIGFDRKSSKLRQAKGNMNSTRLNLTAVDSYVEAEKQEGRLVGPIPPELHKHCKLSPIGLIPKKHQPHSRPLLPTQCECK